MSLSRVIRRIWVYQSVFTLLLLCQLGVSQPQPGDFYREYFWVPPAEHGFLRVGGHLDYSKGMSDSTANKKDSKEIQMPFSLELKNVEKAEVTVQKLMCHDNTTGLRISINGNEQIMLPEPAGITQPQEAYMYRADITVPLPLEQLQAGEQNFFSMKVDSQHTWDWPQNLIYGVIVRLYYSAGAFEPFAQMQPISDSAIQQNQRFSITSKHLKDITQVDYVGLYEDVNLPGDGIYYQWQYYYHRASMRGHIGTSTQMPFTVQWDNAWVPDQEKPISVAAIVTLKDSTKNFILPVENLHLQRPFSVELCKPFNQPQGWVTRNDRFYADFTITGDLNTAEKIRLVTATWSPGYLNGIYLNDHVVFTRAGDKYNYDVLVVETDKTEFLHHGINRVATGLTPRYHGTMVHGAEILWPGVTPLIRYNPEKQKDPYLSFTPQPSPQDYSLGFKVVWSDSGLVFLFQGEDDTLTRHDRIDIVMRRDYQQLKSLETKDSANCVVRVYPHNDSVEFFLDSFV